MTDILKTIEPKSDQLNADDFMAGQTKTITVTGVSTSSGEQPVSISFDGDNGKPYKPCKSMRRVLVHTWGADAKKWAGRKMTLFCDPKVKFAGQEVGGIRISHVSNISAAMTMALTASKAKRKPYTVKPLDTAEAEEISIDELRAAGEEVAKKGGAALDKWLKSIPANQKYKLKEFGPAIRKIADEIDKEAEKSA